MINLVILSNINPAADHKIPAKGINKILVNMVPYAAPIRSAENILTTAGLPPP